MNTLQLEKAVKHLLGHSPVKFLGVVARDEQLPELKLSDYRNPVCWIANTDIEGSTGIHWVAFYSCRPGEIEFYDSFAHPISFYSFRYIRCARVIHAITHQLQSDSSSTCGTWCLYFIGKRARCRTLIDFQKHFQHTFTQNDFAFNDRLIARVLKRILK